MKINTINCRKCHAPLALHGNIHRCRNLICQYCGTVMDSRNDFKALYSFTHIQSNSSELRIGMQGMILGVSFEITGFITYVCKESEWLQFQLYSVTHGYAKLIIKDGKFIFLKKTHYLPNQNLWLLKSNDIFIAQKKTFRIQSFYFTEIYYAAGNLIETIKQGKRNKQCFAKSNGHWFQSIHRRDSVENFIGFEMSGELLGELFVAKRM